MTKKILIYGGYGGIGSTTARLLHERGYELHLVGRDDNKLKSIANELKAGYTVGDVTDESLFADVAKESGDTLDGLVYAVGTINLGSLRRLTKDDFWYDIQVNAVGAALAIKASLHALKKSQGPASVVLFSSVAALQGFNLHASIGMAKGAVSGLTLALGAELAPHVRVNAIAPSLTSTPLAEKFFSNEKRASALAKMHALERLGAPEDIAELTTFLLSPKSSWVTGQIISVDGGRSSLRN